MNRTCWAIGYLTDEREWKIIRARKDPPNDEPDETPRQELMDEYMARKYPEEI